MNNISKTLEEASIKHNFTIIYDPKKENKKIICKCNNCGYNFEKYLEFILNPSIKVRKMCPKCTKVSYNDYKIMENEKNIIFLGLTKSVPKTTDVEMFVKCKKCDNKWKSSYHKEKRKNGCSKCTRKSIKPKKRKYKDYIELEKDKNVTFIDITNNNIPKKTTTITNVRCNRCGHEWESSYSKLRSKNCTAKCPNCYKVNYNDYLKLEKIKNIKFININKDNIPKNIDSNTKIKCSNCNSEWESTYHRLKIKGCPFCRLIKYKDYIKLAKKKNVNFTEISKDNIPQNCLTKTKVYCNICKKEFYTTYDALKRLINCPNCSSSKGEKITRLFIEAYYLNNFPKKRPKWLINPKTNRKLELDGFCEELNKAFEYNGVQHYEEHPLFETKIEYQKEKDLIKVAKCKEKNVKLIIVKQFERFTIPHILKKIQEAFEEAEIDFNKDRANKILEDIL